MFKKTKIAAVTAAVLGVSAMAVAPSANADLTLGETGAGGQQPNRQTRGHGERASAASV